MNKKIQETYAKKIKESMFSGDFEKLDEDLIDYKILVSHDKDLELLSYEITKNYFHNFLSFQYIPSESFISSKEIQAEKEKRELKALSFLSFSAQLYLLASEVDDIKKKHMRLVKKIHSYDKRNNFSLSLLLSKLLKEKKYDFFEEIIEKAFCSLDTKISNLPYVFKNKNTSGMTSITPKTLAPIYAMGVFYLDKDALFYWEKNNSLNKFVDLFKEEGIFARDKYSCVPHMQDEIDFIFSQSKKLLLSHISKNELKNKLNTSPRVYKNKKI